MNDPFSTVVGLVIFAASAFLFWLGAGPSDQPISKQDANYWESRRRRRHWISAMLAAVGACAVGAGFYGPGHAWMILWAVTPVFLMGMIAVAGVDAFVTRQHFHKK